MPPIEYMARTRRWYAALGFDTPYQWAENAAIPFTPLRKPLSDSRVALVTTAALFDPAKGDQGPGAAYNGGAKFYTPYRHPTAGPANTRISHIAYDRDHTSAEDQGTWLPLAALHRAVKAGQIGALTEHFHGAPTNRSQRATIERDAPALLSALRDDAAEAVILVPNCPVCHQTTALIARHLEQNGLPTVVMACARDIVEAAGTPRFVFSDFPLGNAAGRPHDIASQESTLALALDLLESAHDPGASAINPLRWSDNDDWKRDYSNPDRFTPEELAEKRRAFDAAKAERPAER